MEDLIQDAYVAYLRQEHVENAKAWLAVTLRSLCLLRARRQRYSKGLAEAYARVALRSHDSGKVSDLLMDLEVLEGGLPANMRQVIQLTRLGYTTKEMEALLSKTEENVRKLRYRATMRMRTVLLAEAAGKVALEESEDA